jgi:hypothetical protein
MSVQALHIFLDSKPHLCLAEGLIDRAVRGSGILYTPHIEKSEIPLFYDWLEDDLAKICGVEIHLPDEHPLANALHRRPYVTFAPYPRIHFRDVPTCRERGIEAFGDIALLTGTDDAWLIAVGLEEWLAASDVSYIRSLVEGSECPKEGA